MVSTSISSGSLCLTSPNQSHRPQTLRRSLTSLSLRASVFERRMSCRLTTLPVHRPFVYSSMDPSVSPLSQSTGPLSLSGGCHLPTSTFFDMAKLLLSPLPGNHFIIALLQIFTFFRCHLSEWWRQEEAVVSHMCWCTNIEHIISEDFLILWHLKKTCTLKE